MPKADLAERDIESMVKTVMATTNLDARIAWAVLEGLRNAKLAGPWTQGDTDKTWWDRKTHDGRLVAGVWDRDGDVGGRLGRGQWNALKDYEVHFPGVPESEVYRSNTLQEAVENMDALLRDHGWTLMP